MLLAFCVALLNSVRTITGKKALNFEIKGFVFKSFAFFIPSTIFFFALPIYGISLPFYGWELLGILFVYKIFSLLLQVGGQEIERQEKISVLAPYRNLDKIIAVIIAFFLYGDTSVYSLIACLGAFLLLVFSAIDFQNLQIPRNLKKLLVLQFLWGLEYIWLGYLILHYAPVDFYFYTQFVGSVIILFVITFLERSWREYQKVTKKFLFYRCATFTLGQTAGLMGLFLLQELGIVLTSLLGLVTLITSLVLSFFVFGDRPSKKDLLVAIGVSILIFLGMYYR